MNKQKIKEKVFEKLKEEGLVLESAEYKFTQFENEAIDLAITETAKQIFEDIEKLGVLTSEFTGKYEKVIRIQHSEFKKLKKKWLK